MIPGNAVAETVVKLQKENESISAQIQKNTQIIEELTPLAEWEEEPVPDQATLDQS
jgi:hypothetical protein